MLRVLLFVVLVLACTASVKSDLSEIKDVLQNLNSLKLLEGLADLDYSSPCINDTREYLKGLRKGEEWALKMFDSSAKIPDGFLMGTGKIMGQYGECIKVEHPEKSFDGQHCMLAITLNIDLGNITSDSPDYGDGGEDGLNTLKPGISGYGMCVPSSCSAFEIETGLNLLFNKTLNGIISVELDRENCRTKEPRKLKDTDWAVIGILIAFGVVACLSTIYDLYHHFILKNGKPHPLLTSFSIYSNGKFLFQISENTAQLKALHGIRVFSISWIVLCHAYMVAINGPVVNLFDLFEVIQDVNHVVIVNGFIAVDSFFFLSGLLVCIVFFRDMSKKGYYDVPLSYIHRYIRLTPPYAVMILIMSTIILNMGDGPLWYSTVEPEVEVCHKSWWSGILYVQSFVEPNSNCVSQSWYLSTDMQMYWLSPLVLYPMYLFPTFAPILIGLLILVAVCGTFVTVYVNDLGASLAITQTLLQMDLEYCKFYSRATPYLVGIATGYLICGIQAKKIQFKLKPVWVLLAWLLAAGIALGSLYGIVPFTDYKFKTIDAAFYVAFHRLGWTLGLAWVVVACVLGYGGPVNTLLSWNIFQPLGKLSYNVFLVHGIVQMYRMGSYRTNIYIGDLEMTNDFLADLVLSNLLAIPLTLIFEMPFGNIDRYLFRNVRILPLPRPKKTIKKEEKNKGVNNNEDEIEKGNVNNGFEKESE